MQWGDKYNASCQECLFPDALLITFHSSESN